MGGTSSGYSKCASVCFTFPSSFNEPSGVVGVEGDAVSADEEEEEECREYRDGGDDVGEEDVVGEDKEGEDNEGPYDSAFDSEDNEC